MIADVVILPRTTGRDWAVESVDVDRIRQLTDALAIVLVGDDLGPTDLADALVSLAAQRRDTVALDLAVTRAFDRRVLVIGDVDAIEWSGHELTSARPAPRDVRGRAAAEPAPHPAPDAGPAPDAADFDMAEPAGADPDPESCGARLPAAGPAPVATERATGHDPIGHVRTRRGRAVRAMS